MMYLLDPNICIYIINHKPIQVFARFSKIDIRQVAIFNISVAELAFGMQKSGSQKNKLALEKFLSPLTILEYPNHAIALNATLITNNVKEFAKIPKLLLGNWV